MLSDILSASAGTMFVESDLDKRIYHDLLAVEEALDDPLEFDPKPIKSLLDRLGSAIARNALTTKTVALVRNVAAAGADLARFTSRIHHAREDVERKRQYRLVDAMGKLSLENGIRDVSCSHVEPPKSLLEGECTPVSNRTPAPEAHQQTSVLETNASPVPSHVLRCSKWLLKNLHGPYPPTSFRVQVSRDAGVSQKAICDWFTNARRKIGWTALSQKHFRRERALTVDCARVVLLGERSKVPICKELHDTFLTMKDTAERLFGDVLGPSEAAKHLDDLVARHSSRPGQIDQDGLKKTSKAGHQQVNETTPRISSKKVLGKRCAPSDECADSVAISKSSLERRQVKRMRTSPSMDSTDAQDAAHLPQSATSLDSKVLSTRIEIRRPSLKRRLSDDDEPRLSKRYRSLPDDKDTNVLGTSAEVDIFGSVSAIPSDNTYDTTADSLTPSPSTSLLTVSDESIGSPSPPSLEETHVIAYSDPDSSSLSDFFNFKDLFELPDMPTFACNGSDILPPSFEPFPLSADFSVSHLEPNDDPSHCLPSLVDFDSSWLSSLESNLCIESGLDASAPNSTNIQEPGSDAALFSDFFQEFFCSQDSHRSEQSRGKSDEL
ncbi:hypothetical protein ACEPAI_369 [Sanghuangporus weigelae]